MTYQVKSKQYTGYIHRCVAYQDSRVILRFDRALLNESKKAAHRHAATSVKAWNNFVSRSGREEAVYN